MKRKTGRIRGMMAAVMLALIVAVPMVSAITTGLVASAATQTLAMGPMQQSTIINPGDSYEGSFEILNPAASTETYDYTVRIRSFYVDENYNTVFDEDSMRTQIADWITITSPLSGSLEPNQSEMITYTIDVPQNAPAGGQYAAIVVSADTGMGGATVQEKQSVAHTIFAEITGSTKRQGEITSVDVPGFLTGGELKATSEIKNTGNVHGTATYTIKVTPLFSSEEVFTNEEKPETHIILPERTFYNETVWEDTPAMGLFNVSYTVEFEGVKQEMTKLVIICPIWLMLIIIFLIAFVIAGVVMKIVKNRRG